MVQDPRANAEEEHRSYYVGSDEAETEWAVAVLGKTRYLPYDILALEVIAPQSETPALGP